MVLSVDARKSKKMIEHHDGWAWIYGEYCCAYRSVVERESSDSRAVANAMNTGKTLGGGSILFGYKVHDRTWHISISFRRSEFGRSVPRDSSAGYGN